MTTSWTWKLAEAAERIRHRYQHIGRKTGAPFLAIVYPMEDEVAVMREWRAHCAALAPDYRIHEVDCLAETHATISEIGVESVVDAINQPMPGSEPLDDLADAWRARIGEAVRSALSAGGPGKPVVVLARTAALWPAAGPRDIMQSLWDSAQSDLDGPVVVLIPGRLVEPRTYRFLDRRNEFMYRGDLL
jgi:hypothetical protein